MIKNQGIRYRVAIILALMTFWSTTGFSFSLHFCQHQFRGISSIENDSCCSGIHKGCKMSEDSSKTAQIKSCQKDCCVNTQFHKKAAEDILHYAADQLSNSEITAYPATQIILSQKRSTDLISPDYRQYRPPLIISDRCISLQVFRI